MSRPLSSPDRTRYRQLKDLATVSGREAGDAQDDQAGGKTAARLSQPADHIRTRETAEIAEGIDEADGAGAAAPVRKFAGIAQNGAVRRSDAARGCSAPRTGK